MTSRYLFLVATMRILTWATGALALEETTHPEFECTAIKIHDASKGTAILGHNKYPSTSLRRYSNGDWQFKINELNLKLNQAQIKKSSSLAASEVSYEVNYKTSILKFELTGRSPSRNGQLWEWNTPPLQSTLVASITCH